MAALRRERGALLFALLFSGGCSCGGGDADADAAPAVDARVPGDGDPGGDAIAPLAWVDFSIEGCPEPAADPEACVGPAPLELRFAPVAPAPIDTYRWQFGDGDTDERAAPTHRFELPGSYTVSLGVSGPGGSASVTKVDKVVVVAAPLGARCTADAQCATGDCVCGDGAGCAPALAIGICSASCAGAPCDDGLCADLAGGEEDWQRALCLAGCGDGEPCAPGLACRALRGAGGGFVEVCFPPDLLGEVGTACADPSGALEDALCASGFCLDIGARGACSAPCAGGDCPPGAACATFKEGGSFCLARCGDSFACAEDPWLACELAGEPPLAGAKDFTVDEPAAAAGYCAPRRCTGSGDCGPDGSCTAGFCGP